MSLWNSFFGVEFKNKKLIMALTRKEVNSKASELEIFYKNILANMFVFINF